MASSNKGIKFSKGPVKVDFTFPFVRLRSLKKGEFFTLKVVAEASPSQVYIRGAYYPSSKTFICSKFDDFCDCRIFKASKLVYTDFIF